jgi:hypothetical protein
MAAHTSIACSIFPGSRRVRLEGPEIALSGRQILLKALI